MSVQENVLNFGKQGLERLAAFPQPPPAPIGPVFTESVSKLLPPDEISLERFNSEYLQRHSGEPGKVLAAARVMKVLDAPIGSVEETVFGVFGEGSQLDISVRIFFVFCFDPPSIATYGYASIVTDCTLSPRIFDLDFFVARRRVQAKMSSQIRAFNCFQGSERPGSAQRAGVSRPSSKPS